MDAIEQIKQASVPRIAYRQYGVTVSGQAVQLKHTAVFGSRALAEHLCGAERCVVLAATLGVGVDRAIKQAQVSSLSLALALDMAANDAIEALCDTAMEQIAQQMCDVGQTLTRRFSPGYGDFSLMHQPDLLRLTEAQKQIGLSVTDTNLLIPQKSITAVIGILHESEMQARPDKCRGCASREKCKQERG